MQGDPRSQRSPCNTLHNQVPLSRGTAEERSDDAGGSAKPNVFQQHPPGSQTRPSSLEGEPEEQGALSMLRGTCQPSANVTGA